MAHAQPSARATLVMCLVLAACATATIETARIVPGDPAGVRTRLEAELSQLGFRRAAGSFGSLEATTGNAEVGWAACPPVLVGSSNEGRRMATAGRRSASLRINLAANGSGTAVTVVANFTASYLNPISNYRPLASRMSDRWRAALLPGR